MKEICNLKGEITLNVCWMKLWGKHHREPPGRELHGAGPLPKAAAKRHAGQALRRIIVAFAPTKQGELRANGACNIAGARHLPHKKGREDRPPCTGRGWTEPQQRKQEDHATMVSLKNHNLVAFKLMNKKIYI